MTRRLGMRARLLSATTAVVLIATYGVISVQAVHDVGVFQMDGNAQTSVQSNPTASEDWDLICKANPSTCTFKAGLSPAGSTTATASSHIADGVAASIFTTGGSKDPQDLNNWRWKDGSVPDKDNLLHSFAARYSITKSASCPAPSTATNCELLYFGSDRFDNSGDAQQGFWFFQKKVQLAANGTFVNALGQPATHTNGDLLVVSDFSNGGGTSTINVYKWNNGALQFLAGGDQAKCDSTLAGPDPFCGIVNPSNGTIAPWTYTDKSGNSNYLQGELYEAGVNLSDPTINLGNECFSSFLSETRSSTSTTATLKDFVLGQFAVCGSGMTTTPAGAGEIEADGSNNISDSATITVSGGASPPAPTGSVLFYLCGPSATAITSCDANGALKATINLNTATANGNAYTVNSGNVAVTSAGYYCWFSSWSGDGNYPEGASHDSADECLQITPRQPAGATQVSNAGPMPPGTTSHDTFTFSTAPATPSNGVFGTITFKLYGPVATNTATCTEPPISTSSKTVVAGQASYDSDDVSPTGPGFYFWTAAYAPGAGDANNLGIAAACGGANESFQVQQFQPTQQTAQTWKVTDTATISVTGGGPLAGTVHFKLFTTNNCAAGSEIAAGTQNIAVTDAVGDGDGVGTASVTTTPVTFTSTATTLYWQTSYTSTNASHADVAATCTENSSLTIAN